MVDNEWRDNFALAILTIIAVCGMTIANSYLPAGNLLHAETMLALISINAVYAGHRVGISWSNKGKKKSIKEPVKGKPVEQLPPEE
jgi:hypothetical protein